MKRAVFEELGKPWDVLQIKEEPLPEPGEGEVRIKVTVANINPSDIMYVQGMYGIRPEVGGGAGFEAAGIVDGAGEGVSLPVGTRVIFTALGVWQEYVTVPAKTVIPAPEGMSDEIACQAFVNPFTAHGMLKESGLKKSQWLLLTAGGSAFAKFVVQMASKQGINTLCTVRRDSQIEELKANGATAVVNTESQNLKREVKALTDGKGIDYIFDAVGGELGAQVLDTLAFGGTMMVFGLLSLQPIPLNSGLLIFKDLKIKGFWLTTWMASLSTEEKIEVTKTVLGGLMQSALKADVEKTYSLDEVAAATKHADSPGRTGKILLKVS